MTQVTDDFNRADSATDLGANWTDITGSGLGISGNQGYNSTGASVRSAYTATAFGGNQYCSVTWTTLGGAGSGRRIDLMVRQSGTSGGSNLCGYTFRIEESTATFTVFRTDNNAETTLITDTSLTVSAGATYSIQMVGADITVSQNGVPLGTVSDATYATGAPAIGIGSNGTIRVDNFEAGDVATAYNGVPVLKYYYKMISEGPW